MLYAGPVLRPADRTATLLRSDAARNRAAIVEAARALFGSRGLEAPLDEIARHAGVGNATLYRHFPTRCALIAAVFERTLTEAVEACERNLANPDPWAGFAEHVRFLCSLQADDRGLADLMTTRVTGAPELERLRARNQEGIRRLAERAKEAGVLRPDFATEDLPILLMANAGVIHRTSGAAPSAWQRLVHYVLDGLRCSDANTPSPTSPGLRAVRTAMQDQARLIGCS